MSFIITSFSTVKGQQVVKGMVLDSATLTNLQGVHVVVKSSHRITATDSNGLFWIVADASDTLIFSYVGYGKIEVPADIVDDVMLVRMSEQPIQLKEVTIEDTPLTLEPRHPKSPTLESVKPLTAAGFSPTGGVGLNIDYFTKLEREKRKLVKLLDEQRRSQVYVDIVTDPDLSRQVTERFSIDEARYYEILARFNQEHSEMMYSGNEAEILNSILSYFKETLSKR